MLDINPYIKFIISNGNKNISNIISIKLITYNKVRFFLAFTTTPENLNFYDLTVVLLNTQQFRHARVSCLKYEIIKEYMYNILLNDKVKKK